MALSSKRLSGEPDLRKAAENAPPMQFGAKGPGVVALQLALVDLGFPMPISTRKGESLPDGIFGSETQGAVKAFQRANALVPDGVVGRMTLARLDLALGTRSELGARSAQAQGRKLGGLG